MIYIWDLASLGTFQMIAQDYGSRQVHFFLAFLHTILTATVGDCRRLSATVGAYRRLSAPVGDCRRLSAPIGDCRRLSAPVGELRRLSAPVGELSVPDSCGRLSICLSQYGR